MNFRLKQIQMLKYRDKNQLRRKRAKETQCIGSFNRNTFIKISIFFRKIL